MPSFEIKADPEQIRRIEDELREISNGVNRALAAAINRTLTSLRSRVSTRIGKELNLKKGAANNPQPDTISSFLRVIRPSAQGDSMSGAVVITGKPISLYLFAPTPNIPGKTDLPGVSVKTRKGRAREMLRHTFIANDKTGRGVYEREGRGNKRSKRYPLSKRFGPSPLGLYENAPGIQDDILADAGRLLAENIDSQVNRLLSRRKSDA